MSPERQLALRERQIETSRKAWVRAAEAALTLLPGASCSDHPAYDLWLRVEMAKMPPMEVGLSDGAHDASTKADSGTRDESLTP